MTPKPRTPKPAKRPPWRMPTRAQARQRPPWISNGTPVWYRPVLYADEPRYAGRVGCDPFQLGDGTWVAHLDMLADYRAKFAGRTRVHAAMLAALEPREAEAGDAAQVANGQQYGAP